MAERALGDERPHDGGARRSDRDPGSSSRARGPNFYREIGRRGGEIRRGQLGSAGYRALGRQGGEARKQTLGAEGYAALGKKGGEARKRDLGSAGYAALGRKGGQRVAELIRRGRMAIRERNERS